MKPILRLVLFLFIPFLAQAQNENSYTDSLKTALKNAPNDTVRIGALSSLIIFYIESDRDTALFYSEQGLSITKKMKQPFWEAEYLLGQAYIYQKQYNLALSFKLTNDALAIAQDEKNEKNAFLLQEGEDSTTPHAYRMALLSAVYHQLGNIYANAKNNEKAIEYWKKAIEISESLGNNSGLVNSNMNIGSTYIELNQLDSALLYLERALHYANLSGYKTYEGAILEGIGDIYFKGNQLDSAKQYYWNSIEASRMQNNLATEISVRIALAKLYKKAMQPDSVKHYAEMALLQAKNLKQQPSIGEAADLLSKAWEMEGVSDSAYAWLRISKTLSDSITTAKNLKLIQFQNTNFGEQMRLEKEAQESAAAANRIKLIALIVGAGLLAIIALVFYRNNRQKQKANGVLENTLSDLKSAQSQLIQSEKMASLGELTAGIAHEIQNPLNFVNNFSELNSEMIDEQLEEIERGDFEEVKVLALNIKENESKITHHGKRADAIVKGMLAHSRSGKGEKALTDLNALAEEYLKLSYHGLRAKDKSFNADFKTDFDPNLPKMEVVPQDIGRVLLNLFNNAFQEVSATALSTQTLAQVDSEYKPLVTVSTKKTETGIEISVADNGNGIPKEIIAKIFQPFFTTKPTGQGTGLGLSLSYDIVKAHGGEISLESKEAVGSTFNVQLAKQ